MYVGKTITNIWHPKMFLLAQRNGGIKFTLKMGVFVFVLNTLDEFVKSHNESENWTVGECPLENDAVCFPYS